MRQSWSIDDDNAADGNKDEWESDEENVSLSVDELIW
jgi:hypothetical protein